MDEKPEPKSHREADRGQPLRSPNCSSLHDGFSSGAISETHRGVFPAMKMTEPYSPTARAKAEAGAGDQQAARIAGSSTLRGRFAGAWRREVAAASSFSRPELGCEQVAACVRMKGRPTRCVRDQDTERRVGWRSGTPEGANRASDPTVSARMSVVE
jgi:hypothetical protein